MKLSAWAHQRGICYQTAWRMWKTGKLPVPACQLPSGTIVVDDVPAAGGVGLYARVSSAAEKDRLKRQMRRLEVYAASMGWSVIDKASEIATVTNENRRGLQKLLKNRQIRTIVVETPDRILRPALITSTLRCSLTDGASSPLMNSSQGTMTKRRLRNSSTRTARRSTDGKEPPRKRRP